MTASDGSIGTLTKIVDNGPASARWNLVLISEGYQEGQLPMTSTGVSFARDAQDFVDRLFATAPFNEPTIRRAINVYRLNVSSIDPGADNPGGACGGDGSTARTYFDATYCAGGLPRLLGIDYALTTRTLNAALPEWDAALVIVNHTQFGGAGVPFIATCSKDGDWRGIGIHELGHSAFGLADEYDYYVGCGLETNRNIHPAMEPRNANVTIDSNRMTNKWRDLIAETTDLPTTTNPDCTMCDTRTTSSVPAGTVGAFMGANYYHCGVFRPEFNCLMRNLGVPQFCAVCQRRIRQVITANFADDFGVFYRGDSDWLVWRAYTDERWHSEEIFNARHPFSTRLGAGPFITGGTEAAPAVVAGWAGYPLAVFFRGPDDRLHWKVHHQGRWHGDALIEGGGPLTSDPAIMTAGPNQAAIFYRGADNWLVWREYSGGNWQGEEIFNDRHSYPTRMKGAPAVVAGWQGSRFAVFFRGEDDRLHWKAHAGDRWHSDALVEGGGPLTSDPAVIVTGPDELAVFYRGEGDWLVWRAYAGGQWHNEEIFNERHPYPTRIRSAPAVVGGWGGYRFAVFFRGEDDRLHWKAHTGDRWHSDALLEGGGLLTSRPGVVPFAL